MIDLPLTPGPVSMGWQVIDYGGRQTPALGGPVTRVNRLGNRLAVAVALPPMQSATGRLWVSALTQALTQGVRWRVRQPDMIIGAPGAPTVDGAGQAGATLAITGAQPGYAFRVGQIVAVGGRLAMLAGGIVVAANGKALLPLTAALRAEPAGAVEVAAPMIEGLLEGDGLPWSISLARHYGLSFTIAEAR
ncbi:hypothetical protein [Sphingomonas sp.]|jgi:hypothetical protein|uniref:hypothetical protein n=1 Tax=Sphingomonas sp. TaxID=28214 RepID=UPI002D7FE546|nr:hypothetical protein [Sphingomonas sp.]HEU0045075.1 hypothetical protein [Sphingomonas sp.]